MKTKYKVLSLLLSVATILSTLVLAIPVSAAETADEEETVSIADIYLGTVYKTPEEKLASMKKMISDKSLGYELYVDSVSGEVAVKNIATGEILFSNPYDVASADGADDTKKELLSQVIIQYTDNGISKTINSFVDAAEREQIKVYRLKNGVRVEYTIGREESRKLLPRRMFNDDFVKYIQEPLQEAREKSTDSNEKFRINSLLTSFYRKIELTDNISSAKRTQLLTTYPVLEKSDQAIWVFDDEAAKSRDINEFESYIKKYCEDYSFDQMDKDHEATGYVAQDVQFPVFKLALEYTLTENGLSVRMPCNGLRYDMSVYQLESISILPYFGAGNTESGGYNFYPDGSGSLFDFTALKNTTTTVRGKIYGLDYAYHEISGSTYQKTIRYPVFGTVSSEKFYQYSWEYEEEKEVDGQKVTNKVTEKDVVVSATVESYEEILKKIEDKNGTLLSKIEEKDSYDRGYVAFIEEGDSLTDIATYHAGSSSDYNSMITYFNPKPKDSYDISDSISVANSSTWTVVSDRKYTGSLTIRYVMLSDDGRAQKAGVSKYYETSWLGMAEAYRDYLEKDGTLKQLDLSDISEEYMPLYLEVFGALETQETILTVPVNVMTPLTTFEDIQTIYEELSAEGSDIKNINFKMTGYANGGMYYRVPAKLKWEKAVGGASGFRDLIAYAKTVSEKGDGSNLGLFPDFDFAYIQNTGAFDGVRLKRDGIKTIDNRYSSLRQYSATQQKYVSFYQLAISPASYERFYTKLLKKYAKFDIDTMSVASLGTALNSDFDEDEPYNREDDREFTEQALQALSEQYSLMTDGGNAYTWKYIDYLLNVDLDSSRYVKSAASVPFIGTVLHGYVQFAGTPFNEEGDTSHAMLRSIENGSALYFILSYQNTNELKNDTKLSQYYSVQYNIWKDDVIKYYNELNDQMKDLQTKQIIDHEFLTGYRVLDLDELEAEIAAKQAAAELEEYNDKLEKDSKKLLEIANVWNNAVDAENQVKTLISERASIISRLGSNRNSLDSKIKTLSTVLENLLVSIREEGGTTYEIETAKTALDNIKNSAVDLLSQYVRLEEIKAELIQIKADLVEAKSTLQASDLDPTVVSNRCAKIDGFMTAIDGLISDAGIDLNNQSEYTSVKQGIINDAVNAYGTAVNGITGYTPAEIAQMKSFVKDHLITATALNEAIQRHEEEIEIDEEEKEANDRYLVDNNQIVAVVYGVRDAETFVKTPYKTFLLNYNSFAVTVTYGGIDYTIGSGEYVAIQH